MAPSDTNWKFPQSIASGDPKSDSIMLWTRVVPTTLSDIADSSTDVAITLEVTTVDNSSKFGSTTALTGPLLATVTVPAYGDFDGTIRHKLTGLTANTTYFYQFVAGSVRSKVGRFKTAPAAASTADVKFAFMSCQDWSDNHWGAFSQIVADDGAGTTPSLDFIVHLGDYIYEKHDASTAEASHLTLTMPSAAGAAAHYAIATADYRYLYKTFRSDARLQALHERFPMIAVWDDHEFSDDSWQDHQTYGGATNSNPQEKDRRRSANQAWFEYTPADISYSETNSTFQNIRIYRDLKFGQTVHLVMTDERLYRTDHMIPENTINNGAELGRINSRYLAPEASYKQLETIKSGVGTDGLAMMTMLGETQRQWWRDTMASSSAKWKVWGNEVSLLRMGLHGTKAAATLVALQTVQLTPDNMTSSASNAQVQALPKVVAGALNLITVGGVASPTTAAGAAFTILQSYSTALAGGSAAPDAAATAIGAGMGLGLTMQQASDCLNAMGAKTPTAQEIGICAATVTATTTIYMTLNKSKATASTDAGSVVVGLLLTDAGAGGTAPDAALLAVAKGSTTLSNTAGNIIVAVYKATKTAVDAGGSVAPATQIKAGAGTFLSSTNGPVVLGMIRTEVETYKTTSSFAIASGQLATLSSFFQKFLLNADQWDGYSKERKELMNFLINKNIKDVVAVTGDIHSFYAGQVYNDYPGEISSYALVNVTPTTKAAVEASAYTTGTPAMVDLVTAGISSTSWYEYLKDAAQALSASLVSLVSYSIPAAPAAGHVGLPVTLNLPVLDFTMGKSMAPAVAAGNLFAVARDSLKQALASAGIPENNAAITGAGGVNGIATLIAGNSSFQLLCSALAYVGAENSWLKHVDTNAQGYAVVTASTNSLSCEFKKLNTVFRTGGSAYAPGSPLLGGADPRGTISSKTTITLDRTQTISDASYLTVGATIPVS
ncbi:MAG: alkaline phosphatase D family protein [Polyangiaceae bacterium]